MRFEVVTLFPELFDVLNTGLLAKAREAGRITVRASAEGLDGSECSVESVLKS